MKRLGRLFNLTVALLVALWLATVAFWARSVWVADSFSWGDSSNYHFIDFDSGRIVLWSGWEEGVPPPAERWRYRSRSPMIPNPGLSLMPMADYGPGYVWFGIPFWVPFTILTFLVAILGWIMIRPARTKHIGLCLMCGYDLRATPERCPECGAIPHGAAVAKQN